MPLLTQLALQTLGFEMEKIQKSQLAKMVLFLLLIIFIPFISSSLRPSYLYLILNVLIIVLGVEAGLLGKTPPRTEGTPILPDPIVSASPPIHMEAKQKDEIGVVSMNTPTTSPECAGQPDKPVVEKKLKVAVSKDVIKPVIRRCPSRPSLFFIGGYDAEEKVEDHDQVEVVKVVEMEDVFDHGGQELFHKAEMFIGNFYKQLKMQREDSWKKIHGLYQRAF